MSKTSKSDLDANSLNGIDTISIDSDQKIDKLVQDYVKLRSKLTVLKKAYVELNDASAQKDQKLRKYEQELEGLNFRNQQLSARCESLQRELDDKTNVNPPSSSSSSSSLFKPPTDILTEELQHKINENQSLHRRLNELEVDLRQKIVKTEEQLKQTEYEKILFEKKLEAVETSSKITIEKLENDKIKLELSIIQLENQLRSTHMEKEIKENQLIKKESEHHLLVQELSKHSSSSSLNSKKDSETLNLFKQTFESLTRVYPCLVERTKFLTSKQTAKCEQVLKNIEQNFVKLNLKDLDPLIDEYFESSHKMLHHLMEDLVKPETGNDEMETLKRKIKIYLNKLDQLFSDGFSKCLKNLFVSFKNSKAQVSNEILVNGLKNLIDTLDKLLFVLNEKLSLEYTLGYDESVTTNNECLVSYVTQFRQSLTQLISIGNIVDHVVKLKNELSDEIMDPVNDEEFEKLKKLVTDKETEVKNLTEKYEYLRSKSEKDDLDIQNLRSKLESLQLKLVETKQNEEVITKDENVENLEDLDKQLDRPTCDLLEVQIDTLNKRIQHLDSKAYFYYDELKTLIDRLKLQININNHQSQDLHEIKDQLDRTRSSYEVQMSTMSDHLIEMTDRMSQQSEENEKLKHELEILQTAAKTSKNTKKSK